MLSNKGLVYVHRLFYQYIALSFDIMNFEVSKQRINLYIKTAGMEVVHQITVIFLFSIFPNQVRFMICISWLFPAGLFTPVIFGWKQLTSEPPRPEGKCDVSFTYYPIFNTTLILGYFWTTLVVMCGLYVGIYRVAQRLQRKTQSAGRRLAELFAMGDQDLDDFEDGPDEEEGKNEPDQLKLTSASKVKPDNNEHLKLPTLNAKGSVMGNDSGFKDFPTGIDDPISGYESAEMVAQHWLNGPQTDDLGWSDGETQVV